MQTNFDPFSLPAQLKTNCLGNFWYINRDCILNQVLDFYILCRSNIEKSYKNTGFIQYNINRLSKSLPRSLWEYHYTYMKIQAIRNWPSPFESSCWEWDD